MMPQQEYMPRYSSSRRQSRRYTRRQRVFQSVFWSAGWFLLVPIILTIAFFLLFWWHIPLFLSLPILFPGLAVLIAWAVRYGWSRRPPEPTPKE
jgi:Flp pilus assembly protein TadB